MKSLNPTNWKSPTDDWSLTWTQGRRLSGMVSDNFDTVNYTYNADGIRTSKTVNGITHAYTLSGSTIVAEEWTENGIDHTILYLYDAKGTPIGMRYTNSSMVRIVENYLFVTNLQGDIIYIYDDSGNRLATYNYDAWGNHTIEYVEGISAEQRNIVDANPFRYRGYYYDVETGFYYLNSRYYDSAVGRFINADTYVSTGQGLLGNNMFAYCLNNPVNMIDINGEISIWQHFIMTHEWGYVHWLVEQHIIMSHPNVKMEATTKNGGRIDILSTNGEIWEIKHSGNNPIARSFVAMAQASNYVLNYDGGVLGPAGAFNGMFTFQYLDDTYSVMYCTPQSGVILYSVSEMPDIKNPTFVYVPKKSGQKKKVSHLNKAIATAGMLALGGYAYSKVSCVLGTLPGRGSIRGDILMFCSNSIH